MRLCNTESVLYCSEFAQCSTDESLICKFGEWPKEIPGQCTRFVWNESRQLGVNVAFLFPGLRKDGVILESGVVMLMALKNSKNGKNTTRR